jgi:antitoxin PrlF
MAVAILTSKGQMTLPKAVRDDLKVGPGDEIELIKTDGQYVLRPRNVSAAALAGILGKPPAGRAMTVEEMDEALGKALAEDDERIRAGR